MTRDTGCDVSFGCLLTLGSGIGIGACLVGLRTVSAILIFSDAVQSVQLVVSLGGALEAFGIATAFVQVWVLALFLGDFLVDFVQAVADHFGKKIVTLIYLFLVKFSCKFCSFLRCWMVRQEILECPSACRG